MRIKVGDKVKILSGKDKGKIGKVSQILHTEEKIVVDGVNKMIKHLKSRKEGEKGQKIEFFGPIHVSNTIVICPKCSKPARMGYKVLEDGTKQRICKKCNAAVEVIKDEKK